MHCSQRYLLFTSLVFVLLLVGCGHNAGNTGNAGSAGGAGGGGNSATPSPTGKPPTLPVTLQVGATSYQRGSTISVTIENQSGHTIFFADHRTNCTVLLLERQADGSWQSVFPCKLMLATHIHSLKSGEVSVVNIITTQQWPAGYYHARLDYSYQSSAGAQGPTPVYSPQFLLQ